MIEEDFSGDDIGSSGYLPEDPGDQGSGEYLLQKLWLIYVITAMILLLLFCTLVIVMLLQRCMREHQRKKGISDTHYNNIEDPILGELLQTLQKKNETENSDNYNPTMAETSFQHNMPLSSGHSQPNSPSSTERTTSLDQNSIASPYLTPVSLIDEQSQNVPTVSENVDNDQLKPLVKLTESSSETAVYDHLERRTGKGGEMTIVLENKVLTLSQNQDHIEYEGNTIDDDMSSHIYEDARSPTRHPTSPSNDGYSDVLSPQAVLQQNDQKQDELTANTNQSSRNSDYYSFIPDFGIEGVVINPNSSQVLSKGGGSQSSIGEYVDIDDIYTIPTGGSSSQKHQSGVYTTIDEFTNTPEKNNSDYAYATSHMLVSPLQSNQLDEGDDEKGEVQIRPVDFQQAKVRSRSLPKIGHQNFLLVTTDGNLKSASMSRVKLSRDSSDSNIDHTENSFSSENPLYVKTKDLVKTKPETSSIYQNLSNQDYFADANEWAKPKKDTNQKLPKAFPRTQPIVSESPGESNHTYTKIITRERSKNDDYTRPRLRSYQSPVEQPLETESSITPRSLSLDGHKYENRSMWMKDSVQLLSPHEAVSTSHSYTKLLQGGGVIDEDMYMKAEYNPQISFEDIY